MMLEKIKGPHDLKNISKENLPVLAKEIRENLIKNICATGGHLGSSLGVVDLTIALHYVFNSPFDKIVWDVGHQCYTHKILTGRSISDIRTIKGLSGFPKRSESKHDPFGAGHASTSISAALGIAAGAFLTGKKNKTIAVIGDGSLTGGLAYEGLNNIRSNIKAYENLIIILNDNGMSISPNVGGLSAALSRTISGSFYNRLRLSLKHVLSDRTIRFIKRIKSAIKHLVIPGEFFESFGLRYLGVIDGHSISDLIDVLSNISSNRQDAPILLHVKTKKGRGYKYAESSPVKFHGVSRFDRNTGEEEKNPSSGITFTEVFGNALCDVAAKNRKVVAITAAMKNGTGLAGFAKKYPERFYDVGIAEEHAVTFAAGLAVEGFIPIVAIYSSFLQRSFDQIIHDVCLQSLPVIFCIDRAGIVGEDGPTHHGNFDLSYLRVIPNLIVMAPANALEMRNMIYSAIKYNSPVAIRYPREKLQEIPLQKEMTFIPKASEREIFAADVVKTKIKILILSIGVMDKVAARVAAFLFSEGISVKAIDVRFVKPLSSNIFKNIKNYDLVFTLEENSICGGFGSAVLEQLTIIDPKSISKIKIIGIEDKFVGHARREELLKQCKLDYETVLKRVMIDIVNILSAQKNSSPKADLVFRNFSDNLSVYEKRTH